MPATGLTRDNSSLSYTGRDATDIRRTMVDLVPQLTDKWRYFGESDLGMVILEIMAAAQDMQNFYLDTQAFETYLDTAEQPKNVRAILRAMNYRLPFYGAAKGELTITFREPLTEPFRIPAYAQFQATDDGQHKYAAVDDAIAPIGATEMKVKVMEGEAQQTSITRRQMADNLTASGTVSRRAFIGDIKVADGSVSVVQDGEAWEPCDDALLKYEGGRFFSVHKDSEDNTYILFSPNFLDLFPSDETEPVHIKYIVTSGASGVVLPGMITRCIDQSLDQSNILSITNLTNTYGAYDPPDIHDQKILARRQAQNMDRYVTLEDYDNGVATEPYIMRHVTKDWKSLEYVQSPYLVKVWAVDHTGNDLGEQDVDSLKKKFRDKGVTDVTVQYVPTEFVTINISVELYLKASSEANAEMVRNEVRSYLSDYYDVNRLTYGQYFSISMIRSQVMQVSTYIKDADVLLPEDDVHLDEIQFPRIGGITVTSR